MTPEQQAAELNERVKVKLAPSKIQGVGVIALRDLKKGEKLYSDLMPHLYHIPYENRNLLRSEIRDMILGQWPNIINGSKFAYPTTRIQAYMNHSNKPNYDAKNDILLKEVKEGQEITEDYRAIEGYAHIFPWLTEK